MTEKIGQERLTRKKWFYGFPGIYIYILANGTDVLVLSAALEALLEGMLHYGPDPDEISFNAAMTACSSQVPKPFPLGTGWNCQQVAKWVPHGATVILHIYLYGFKMF